MEKRQVDVVVLSDLHLGTYGCRAAELTSYLKSITPQILVLNGDIFDIWQFSKHYFPAEHMDVIKQVLHMLSTGTRVIYITGNHDELLRRYSDLQLGNLQLLDKMVIEIDGKKTWIFHGDVFDHTTRDGAIFLSCLGSNGYAVLLGFNRLVNGFLRFIGREPVSLSKKIMSRVNEAFIKINEFEKLIASIAIENKYDYVICGHIHQPAEKFFETPKGSVTYLNSGDWVEHLTALEYTGKKWQLYEHNCAPALVTKSNFQKPETVMIPEEISMYLHLLKL